MISDATLRKPISNFFPSFSFSRSYTLTDPTFSPYCESTSDGCGYGSELGRCRSSGTTVG